MAKMKLKWRIFVALLGFSGLLLGLLWVFQTIGLEPTYKLVRRFEIEQAMLQVQAEIDSPQLSQVLKQLQEEKEIIVMPSSEFQQGDNQRIPNRQLASTVTETQTFVQANGETIELTFYAIISPVNATITTLQLQLVLITVIMISLAILVAVIIAKYVAKPIEELNQEAKALAEGRYEVTFTAASFLEIAELSTTLNTAAQELTKVEGQRRELLANLSHDLRTPLALIYSYAELMHDFPTEITAVQTETIMAETKRLTSLVNDILDITKIESGEANLKLVPFDFTASMQATVARIQELVKHEGYRLTFTANETVTLVADETKINQALYNLLLNAITHGGDSKHVTITQTQTPTHVRIAVHDDGPGIAQERLADLWERYYKVQEYHKRAIIGSGLGLAIVKQIVVLHHGTYGVSSTVGAGSTFWFELPRTPRVED